MPLPSISPAGVEARTQELGQELYLLLERYQPSANERLQDGLMSALMADASLRTNLLRFIDVLAALPAGGDGQRTADLFREYFRGDYPGLPFLEKLALMAARSAFAPDLALAFLARRATRLTASRFIVPLKADTVAGTIRELGLRDRKVSFDLLGEAVVSEEEAQQYRQAYLRLIEQLSLYPRERPRTPGGRPSLEVSLKLSSLTSQFNPADPDGTLRRVRPGLEEILETAREKGIGVTVDAEQYAYRELIWYIFQNVLGPGEPLARWPDAGMVVQAYCRDVEAHAQSVIEFARRRDSPFQVRLVKGAYWDYEVIVAVQNGWPVPVFQDKAATDLAFQRVIEMMLGDVGPLQLAVGSHNIRSHAYAEAVREALRLPAAAVEHQTLYRTLESLSRSLPLMGWTARDYVPSGDLIPGMAYLVRRILENTSQAGFLSRARFDQEPAELLAPPQLVAEDSTYLRPTHHNGFTNTPTTRPYDSHQRQAFQEALRATRAQWGQTYTLRIGHQEIKTSTLMPSTSPSHPDSPVPVGWVYWAGIEETKRAIALANEAAPGWSNRPIEDRVAIGLRAAELLKTRQDEVAAWVVHEGGRTWEEAQADVEEAVDHVVWNSLEAGRLSLLIRSTYQPRGVVACIPPWNFPTALPAAMTSAALVTGNAVILKSAEQTPVIARALVDAFHDAGVPREVLIHLPGSGETVGAKLVESPDVDMVVFTGSKRVGLRIYRTASSVATTRGGIKRVVAEMGGKNAIVVFPEADMDEAVDGILESAFGHAGQKCSACSRVLVHRDVYQRLKYRLIEAARSLPVGAADQPGTVINPVIDNVARERLIAAAVEARAEGTVLLDLLAGEDADRAGLGPLILEVPTGEAGTAALTQEELFGPILPLMPFDTEEEAVSIVNSTAYALTLGIFSRSPGTINRMVKACRAGNIYVNRKITGARVGIEPFGGFQLSGTGPKTGGEEYVPAFLTRRERYRRDEPAGQPDYETAAISLAEGVRAWDSASAVERHGILSEALDVMRKDGRGLARLLSVWKKVGQSEASLWAGRTLETVNKVLGALPEISEVQPTVEIPGQTNFVRWDTPRGVGLAAVDDGADPANLAALVFGPLLAGNGLIIAGGPGSRAAAQMMVGCLIDSGVPEEVVSLASNGVQPAALAAGPINFAGVDLTQEGTQAVYRVLGITREESGQRWLKALISLKEGPRPGEVAFLRWFAHPRTIAVQTLRHGADLQLL
jgi:RHH-type proline utilization regulon transcriptional repressor/proline dehydrogenase/delta 1-pyrroline-5-carboxylate dehydrogenase